MGMDCPWGYSDILQAGWSILVLPQSRHAGRLHTLLRTQDKRLKSAAQGSLLRVSHLVSREDLPPIRSY